MAFCYPVTVTTLLIALLSLSQATPRDRLTGAEKDLRAFEELMQTQRKLLDDLTVGPGKGPSLGAEGGSGSDDSLQAIERLLRNPQFEISPWVYLVPILSTVVLTLVVFTVLFLMRRKTNRRMDRALELSEDHAEQLDEILLVLGEIRDELKQRPAPQSE